MTTKEQQEVLHCNTSEHHKKSLGDAMNIPPGIDRIPLKDGKVHYRVRIRIKDQKPISKVFPTLKEAIRWKRSTEGDVEKGEILPHLRAEKHTLSEAINRYIAQVLPTKPKDARNVLRHLEFWKTKLGSLPLSKLSASKIGEVRDHLLTEPLPSGAKRANGTVVRYLASLSHVLSVAIQEWEWLKENPCRRVKKPKESPGRIRYLTQDETDRLFEACKNSKNPHIYLILSIAFTTGARLGEILSLTGEAIDLERKLIYLFSTKNGDSRALPMTDSVFHLLKDRVYIPNGLLFPSINDPKKPTDIRTAWETVLKKAGIQDFCFHLLRHNIASHLIMSGASTREVSEMLGHKTLQMTKRYSHLSPQHKKNLADKMEAKIGRKTE